MTLRKEVCAVVNIELLKRLCNASSVSSNESEVRNIIINEIKDFVTSIKVDAFGDIIAFKRGKKRASKKLLISAHMDEVGFIVTHITEGGFLKFTSVGGIDSKVIGTRRLLVGDKKIPGIVGTKPIHLLKTSEKEEVPKISDMYIDIGANNKEEASKQVRLGDLVSFSPFFEEKEDTIKSKALDDRVGCFILINLIKSEYCPVDMYFTFVTQEEIGLRGAKVAAYGVNPDIAIVVEVTTAMDVEGVDRSKQVCRLAGGAVLSFMDRRTIYDREYLNYLIKIADNNKIKYQFKESVSGGNDAGAIQSSRNGVKTVAVSVPGRYIHSNAGIVAKADIEATFRLVSKASEAFAS